LDETDYDCFVDSQTWGDYDILLIFRVSDENSHWENLGELPSGSSSKTMENPPFWLMIFPS
jgi:hypothetical protein